MKFIFWNTCRNKNINKILEELIIENSCEVLILAEYEDDLFVLRNSLYLKGVNLNINANMGGCRVKILINPRYSISSYTEMQYYTIKSINVGTMEIILVCVHLPSLLYNSDEELSAIASIIISEIEKIENELGHRNTIIIGDFNANPFDSSIIKASAFHGIPIRNIAKKIVRTVNYTEYRMFYNPMWNLFGDLSSIPGTYYYDSGQQTNFYWNIFDQVLFRPNIIDYFNYRELKILTSINNRALINNSCIPNKSISDHLPIVFSLDI